MRSRDKLKNIQRANMLAEQRYLQSKGLLNENLSNDEYKIDAYMNGTISEAEFFNGLEQLNEDMGDKLINFVGTTVNKLKSYFNDLKKYGNKIGKVLTWLIGKIKSLHDKYPNLIKALVILTVMVSLVMVSTASMAAGG